MFNESLIYKVVIENPEWYHAQDWCASNIGEFNKDWYKLGIDPMQSLSNGRVETIWFFKREQDAILFKLKWA